MGEARDPKDRLSKNYLRGAARHPEIALFPVLKFKGLRLFIRQTERVNAPARGIEAPDRHHPSYGAEEIALY
jgi:hypothetical protein